MPGNPGDLASALGAAPAGTPTPTAGAPIDLSSFASQYPASVIAAAQNIFSSQPDQAQTFQTQYGGDFKAWLNSFTQWWSNYGNQVANNMGNFQPEANLLGALGYSPGTGGNWQAGPAAVVQAPPLGSGAPGTPGAVPTTSVPAEEGLYDESIGQLNQEVLNDQNLAKQTQQLEDQSTTNYGGLQDVLDSAIAPPGGTSVVTNQENQAATDSANTQITALATSIANQKQSLQSQIAELSGAADTASQQQLAALQTQLATLNSAESSVAAARTAAAQGQVTAVNVALAQAKNQIRGTTALQGFVGGSSMEDNALAQAGIGATQQAAGLVGSATLQNAQDYQGITDLGANSTDALANALAQQKQAITTQDANSKYSLDTGLNAGDYAITSAAAQQKQNNIDNQYGQSLQAALASASLPSQEAGSIASIDNLQNAGLLNAQQALNWWAAPATPPTPTATTTTASTVGNGIASAGAGLLSAATSIGNSNNWWQTPATTAPATTGVPATTPFTTPTLAPIDTSAIPVS